MTAHYGLPSPTALAARRCIRIFWLGQSNAQTQCDNYSELTKWAGPWSNPLMRAYRRSIYLGSDLTEAWRAAAPRQVGVTNGVTGLPGADLVCMRQLIKAGYNVELIEFTQGSTSCYTDWQKTEATCYAHATSAWSSAISTHPAPPSTIVPIIVWIQGESDAQTDQMADAYQTKVAQLFSDLRTDIPAIASAMLFVCKLHPNCVLGGGVGGSRNTKIRNAQAAYAATDSAKITLVETSDLTLNIGDALHYDQTSQITLGRRLSTAIGAYAL